MMNTRLDKVRLQNISRKLLLIIILGTSLLGGSVISSAQTCTDSDALGGSDGKNFHLKGTAKITTGSVVTQSATDKCNSTGTQLTEYYCSSGAIASTTSNCVYGCLDSACVTPGANNPGCFWVFTIKATPSTTTQTVTLSINSATQSNESLWFNMGKTAAERSDENLEIQLRDASNNLLSTMYESINPEYYDAAPPGWQNVGISKVVIPFNALAKSILFKALAASTTYTLPADFQKCGRPCIAAGDTEGGAEGIDSCCTGAIKESYNDTSFTCLASPSPSPSPAT